MVKDKLVLIRYLLIVTSALLYVFITYFVERPESVSLLTSYTALFGLYILIYKSIKAENIWVYVGVGIFFRLLLLPSFPNLSDDIYRFVWDGKLLASGVHPFAELPSTYFNSGQLPEGTNVELYNSLNSKDYFTIYPPLAQFIYWLSVIISPNSVKGSAIVIRVLIIMAEVGSLYYLTRLLEIMKKPAHRVLLYSLNPLVIIELTGNLHFEAFMIFGLIVFLYFFIRNKTLIIQALTMSAAIVAKLLPIMLLPILIKRLNWRKLLSLYGLIGFMTLLMFWPLIDIELFSGMQSSLSLYFQKFEFNASIYYVVRELGFWIKGYNIIETAGKYLALASFISILIVSFLGSKNRQSVPEGMMWVLTVYFLFTTTLHPWYVTTLVALSLLTNYKYTVVWSLLIFFTYVGYVTDGFQENLIFTAIEYIVVILFMIYEIYKSFKPKIDSVTQPIA